jgi:3-methyladenine DNA glycosylase AlkD
VVTPKKTSIDGQVTDVLAMLERVSTTRDYDNLARFGIAATNALGVSMANIQRVAKRLGRSHALALALWNTGVYEARLLTAFVDEPARVTSSQMDRWCREFDNWGVCDTLCFKLFDQTPHAWGKVDKWAGSRDEFVKRAGFALLASLAGHDKAAPDQMFRARLPLIERAAGDERNFVKKGVSWALRRVGTRSPALGAAALEVAERLAASDVPGARWVGRDAVRELQRSRRAR